MNQILVPKKYELYMQDLSKDFLELTFLGYVRTLSEAKNMCKVFKEVLLNSNKTVFFRCVVEQPVHQG